MSGDSQLINSVAEGVESFSNQSKKFFKKLGPDGNCEETGLFHCQANIVSIVYYAEFFFVGLAS